MDVDRPMKKNFLLSYDYGMGCVWCYMDAHSTDEILKKYPDFKSWNQEPDWFTDETRNTILHYDIDQKPDEFLEKMMQPD